MAKINNNNLLNLNNVSGILIVINIYNKENLDIFIGMVQNYLL